MRKFIIPLLLASVAATPAIADPNNNQVQIERQQAREQRAQARDEARADRGANRPAYAGPRGQQLQGPQGRDMARGPQFNEGGRFQQQVEARRNGYAGQGNFEQQRQAYAGQRQAYAQQQ